MNNILKLIISVSLFRLPLVLQPDFLPLPRLTAGIKLFNKPSWNPPSWIFGPVWTTLLYFDGDCFIPGLETDASKVCKKNELLSLFAMQLVLNFFWSFIFFNQQQIGWAFVEIIVLWLMLYCLPSFAFAQYQ